MEVLKLGVGEAYSATMKETGSHFLIPSFFHNGKNEKNFYDSDGTLYATKGQRDVSNTVIIQTQHKNVVFHI